MALDPEVQAEIARLDARIDWLVERLNETTDPDFIEEQPEEILPTE